MCGILAHAGIKPFDAKACLDRLAHRGPDHGALLESSNVTLGHRRLSIIDVSASSDQPFVSASGKTAIVYNGEIYNYRELRAALVRDGVRVRTEGDTEVIVEGYERYGAAFFDRLRGMWALVIHDREKGTLVLARDPFGIKPLVYAVRNGELYAASEIRCLKGQLSLEPDPESYVAFYTLGYFIAPQTPYKGVSRLAPGEVRSWSLAEKTFTPLARVSRIMPLPHDETSGSVLDMLDTVLTGAVEAHYVADVPVSMLLSGGTDSSLIAALSKKLGKAPTAYHVAISGSEDTRYAEAIAAHLGLALVVEELTEAALKSQYEQVWDVLDEPTGDISIIPTSLIFERMRGKTKVVLSGEGGDELFGGYLRHATLARHKTVRAAHPVNGLFTSLLRSDAGSAVWNPLVERARTQTLKSGAVDDLVGAYLASVRLMRYPFDDARVRRALVALYEAEPDAELLPMLAFDLLSYLPNDLLPKSDIASMAASLEARVPLVDRKVAAAAQRAAAQDGLPQGDKRLLKEVLARYVPRDLAFRGKSGFGVPMHAYDSAAFVADFRHACAFHRTHADAFGVSPELSGHIASVRAQEVIARKFPRFAFALISNWKLFSR